MGDRRMVELKTDDGSLYVYTHWCGEELPEIVMEAIVTAKPRWGDDAYELRILVDQITKDGRDQETGWGLMLESRAEDEYNGNKPSVIVDLVERSLTVINRDEQTVSIFADLV